MKLAPFLIYFHAAVTMLLGWLYFRRYALARPPIGVINLWDVAIMVGGIILVPYLYLIAPRWLVAVLLAGTLLNILYFTLEPILGVRWRIWLTTLVLVSADVVSAVQFEAMSAVFFAINNVGLSVAVVGLTNLWG